MDFYARQEAARRTTRWLLLAFLVSVVLVVVAIDVVIAVLFTTAQPHTSPRAVVTVTTFATLAIIGGASLFKTLSLRSGGGAVARTLGATRIERSTSDPALKRLHNIVEEMSIASGVTMPEIYVLESEDGINAFAAGNSPADAAVCVTRGAVTRLRREELQGVIAHEFSHVLNGDSRLYLRLLGWVFGLLAIAIVARVILQNAPRGGSRDKKGGAGAIMLAALAVMVLGYIGVFFGRLLQAAVSRHRERLADASAVQFTRNPQGLTGALLKIAGIEAGSRIANPAAEQVAHMLFAPGWTRMLATHPSIEERLKELNPSFRTDQLAALAAEAARDAERLRAADAAVNSSAPEVESGRGGGFAPQLRTVVAAAAAHDIAAQAGTLETQHMAYAEGARLAIPAALRSSLDSADHARLLTLVVLMSKSADVRDKQRSILDRIYGGGLTSRVLAMQGIADSLTPELRLPTMQQIFPTLRRLTPTEREQLRGAVSELALADARIDVFECCLALLLAASLRDELEGGSMHGSASLPEEADAVASLLAILATQGSEDADGARRAYEAGIAVVLPEMPRPYAPVDDWPRALESSLTRLAGLRPLAKKVLIEGLVRCVAHDERLSVEEGELLRTTCAALHCPLPPIVARPAVGS